MTIKGYTQKQWAVLILRYDFRMSYREIAEIMRMSTSGVQHIIQMKK